MPITDRYLKRLLLAAICVAWIVPWAMLAKGQEVEELTIPQEYITIVEHSSEIFVGTIDIVTAVSGADTSVITEYTVLVDAVLKGSVTVPMMVVTRQIGGDQLIPGSSYLLFVRFLPAELRYEIVKTGSGSLPIASDDERARLISNWTRIVARTACERTDVLNLDGVTFARRDWNDDKRYLEREWVGPTVATVEFQDTSATGCRDDLGPNVASKLPVGTKVQRLDGYEPTFRVAVRKRDGHRHLYEAIRSETAETGADLFGGIKGRVKSLTYERLPHPDCDDVAMCIAPIFTTEGSAIIDGVVSLIGSAPIHPDRTNWRNLPPERLQLVYTLDDGSTVELLISLRTGLTRSGIEVPVEELMLLLGLE